MVLKECPVRDVVSLLEDAVADRDQGEGDASLEQLALVAVSELLMADEDRTMEEVVQSFQYKWGSAALWEAHTSDYSPALQQLVERLQVS
tara:strand:- start:138 stop:407 length:270 start_codon:yes stop_codon:yes gene_type:complete